MKEALPGAGDEDSRLLVERTLSPLFLLVFTFSGLLFSLCVRLSSVFFIWLIPGICWFAGDEAGDGVLANATFSPFVLLCFCLCFSFVFGSFCVFISWVILSVFRLSFFSSVSLFSFLCSLCFRFCVCCLFSSSFRFCVCCFFFFFFSCSICVLWPFSSLYKAREMWSVCSQDNDLGSEARSSVLEEKLGTCRTVGNASCGRGILGRDVTHDFGTALVQFPVESFFPGWGRTKKVMNTGLWNGAVFCSEVNSQVLKFSNLALIHENIIFVLILPLDFNGLYKTFLDLWIKQFST